MEGKIHRGQLTAGAIDQAGGRDHDAPAVVHDVGRFKQTAPAGHHVFDDDETLARADDETAAKHESSVVVLLGKNVRLAQLSGHFLADEHATKGGRNHRVEFKVTHPRGEEAADPLGHRGVAEEQGALKKIPAVQPRAQDEMSVQQGSGLTEKVENLFLRGVHDVGALTKARLASWRWRNSSASLP